MSYRKRVSIWIGASCLLLAFIGTMQFAWIGQVSDSQRDLELKTLNESLRLVIDDLRFKTWLLLTTFKADADLDRAHRLKHYLQRYYSWHELSMHGSAVKRILFYDMSAKRVGRLTELTGNSGSVTGVAWDDGLASVRRYVDKFGFPPGRGVKSRWTSTWMFHPRAMAVSRPMVADVPSARLRTDWPAITGYLILKLDLDYIRDHLIPAVLDDRFGNDSSRNTRYAVTITLDGESLYVYDPAGPAGVLASASESEAGAYSLTSLKRGDAGSWTGPADQAFPLLLSTAPVTDALSLRGAVQPIFVPNDAARSLLESPAVVRSSSMWPATSNLSGRTDVLRVLRTSSGLPRLFLAADRLHELTVEARHTGMPLGEAMERRYKRSLAMGIVSLLLLFGATAMVAITGSRAAHRAEMRMQAAASQAHALLTPVAVIVALGDNMLKGALGCGKKAMEYGGLFRDYGRRLHGTIDRAMQMAAIDSFEKHYTISTLDVSKVAEDALEDVRPLIDSAGFEAEFSFAEGLPTVRADAQALRQSIGELLGNAVKYGPPGRWVKIETSKSGTDSGRDVQIRVHDRGRGIPAREARKIFEPYYRVADKFTASIPGSGLGLKLVREMVRAMGGKLTLESEEGLGSVFTIHLPVAD